MNARPFKLATANELLKIDEKLKRIKAESINKHQAAFKSITIFIQHRPSNLSDNAFG